MPQEALFQRNESPLEKSFDQKSNVAKFPLDIDNVDHWMAFRVAKFDFLRETDIPVDTQDSRYPYIFLPVPDNLGTQYTHTYNTEGVGALGAEAAKLGKNISGGGVSIDSLVSQVKSQAKNINLTSLGKKVAFDAVSGFETIRAGLAGAGIAQNPFMSVLYNAPALRTHTFEWKFIPRNPKESEELRKIIYLFKYHAAPRYTASKYLFDYPEMFDIDFRYAKMMYNIGPSVLTSFDVGYHGEGKPLYFNLTSSDSVSDEVLDTMGQIKAPASIRINAQFQEIAIVTKTTIDSENR